ncbi:hypothetical protein Q5P01_010131 [Channa striata]|uniref:Uncharacterized protein n=1 Tax=Channa striata TaxID=64152 RepID=A0AA88MZ80_CHASR|nr:hypothetical protein Q5P01_010131 [Channa striata]
MLVSDRRCATETQETHIGFLLVYSSPGKHDDQHNDFSAQLLHDIKEPEKALKRISCDSGLHPKTTTE